MSSPNTPGGLQAPQQNANHQPTPAWPDELVRFDNQNVQPPSPVYIQLNDQLSVQCFNHLNGFIVTVRLRILRADGEVVPVELIFPNQTADAQNTQTPTLCEGFLLSVCCTTNIGSLGALPPLVHIELQRPGTSGMTAHIPILSGYVGTAHPPGFVGGVETQRYSGPGFQVVDQFAAPAAGADFSISPPNRMQEQIRSIGVTLVTSAVVANRQIVFKIVSGIKNPWSIALATPQTASQTVRYVFVPNLSAPALVNGIYQVPLPPDTSLTVGENLQSLTTGLDAGDQWSAQDVAYRGSFIW